MPALTPSPDPAPTRQAALYADPAAHSLSPRMHRAAFAWAGLPGDYVALRVRASELPERLAALRHSDLMGVNLSLPHKEAALPLLDDLTDAARRIGAVNTVVHTQGHLLGDNTDAPGLLAALADADLLGHGGPVVVLGAGGAARAAVYTALVSLKRDVYIVNRTRERAENLARQWPVPDDHLWVRAAGVDEVPWEKVGLVINSSSAGLDAPEQSPLPDFDFGRLPPQAGVYDMVYRPAETRLMREARAAGRRAENGLGMLAHQARLAFLAWTGVDVPAGVFAGAARGDAGL